jgi:curved DNA-binding protein CbpA
MAVAIDYYELLGIPRDAVEDQIKESVRKAMREWRKRTEAADLSVRQEAEVRVKYIGEASETLGNPQRREQYNLKLDREGVQKASAKGGDALQGDWLEKAKSYLARGDYHSAAYAAREATQTAGSSPEGWWIRSRANLGMGRLDDALYEAQQAVEIETNNPDYHFHLGSVAESMSRWNQALNEYQEASRLEPGTAMYQLAVGGIYLQNDAPEKALPIIEAVYKKHPDDENASYYMGMALVEAAEKTPTARASDGYWVTSGDEVTKMRGYLNRSRNLKTTSPEVRSEVIRISGYLDRMEKKRFHAPFGQALYHGEIRSAITCGVVLLLLGLFAFSGLIALFQGSGGGFVFGLILAGATYWWFKATWVPQWKVNDRMRRRLGH